MGTLFAAMGLVFVAELGDKTQLVALGLGARHRLAPVVVGVVIAYAVTNLLSVAVGGLVGEALPTRAIGLAGGVLFLGFALWTFRSGDDGDGDVGAVEADAVAAGDGEDAGEGELATVPAGTRSLSVVASVAVAMFVAELGDKTMLATATLAAQGSPVLVWIGATLGIIASGLIGVLLGRAFGARLPERATRIGSSVLFAAFGLVLIATSL